MKTVVGSSFSEIRSLRQVSFLSRCSRPALRENMESIIPSPRRESIPVCSCPLRLTNHSELATIRRRTQLSPATLTRAKANKHLSPVSVGFPHVRDENNSHGYQVAHHEYGYASSLAFPVAHTRFYQAVNNPVLTHPSIFFDPSACSLDASEHCGCGTSMLCLAFTPEASESEQPASHKQTLGAYKTSGGTSVT